MVYVCLYVCCPNALSIVSSMLVANAGGLNMVTTGLMAKRRGKGAERDINLFLLPDMEKDNKKEETQKSAKGWKQYKVFLNNT